MKALLFLSLVAVALAHPRPGAAAPATANANLNANGQPIPAPVDHLQAPLWAYAAHAYSDEGDDYPAALAARLRRADEKAAVFLRERAARAEMEREKRSGEDKAQGKAQRHRRAVPFHG